MKITSPSNLKKRFEEIREECLPAWIELEIDVCQVIELGLNREFEKFIEEFEAGNRTSDPISYSFIIRAKQALSKKPVRELVEKRYYSHGWREIDFDFNTGNPHQVRVTLSTS